MGAAKATNKPLGTYHHDSKTQNNEFLTRRKGNSQGYESAHVQENTERMCTKLKFSFLPPLFFQQLKDPQQRLDDTYYQAVTQSH